MEMHKSFVLGLLSHFRFIEAVYSMSALLYRKYNAFSNRESAQTEQKQRTMTFVRLPDHVYFY